MKVGIIGGSGVYQMDSLQDTEWKRVETPFGAPSNDLLCGRLEGVEVVFLPRHGRNHHLLPSEVPYCANMWALKSLGVSHVISVSAVGSLREEIAPGHIALPDQFIDRTFLRRSTFFGEGVVVHVSFGEPVFAPLGNVLEAAARKVGLNCHRNGTYICMEGPAFSTKAESALYRSWKASVIGMTNLQEAKLAREAVMHFATIALCTDYDCWHESEEEVTVEAILAVMRANVEGSQRMLSEVMKLLPADPEASALPTPQGALITSVEHVPAAKKEELGVVLSPYLP